LKSIRHSRKVWNERNNLDVVGNQHRSIICKIQMKGQFVK
jgi:hypothetical protein